MSRPISDALKGQLFGQESNDPFLILLTLSHSSFPDIFIVNNSENIISNGDTFIGFPFKITLPVDDGESSRSVTVEFDNVGLDLINEIRSVTDLIDVKLQMILASDPDNIEIELSELKLKDVSYNVNTIKATLFVDDFLNTGMTSERYAPTNFPGLFT